MRTAKRSPNFSNRLISGDTASQRIGVVAPPPLPHPDDIVIDMKTGRVDIRGPMTKEDKAMWDKLRAHKEGCKELIAELEQILRDNPDGEEAAFIRDEIQNQQKLLARIETVMRD